jgi:hypothetical protein
MEEINQGKRKSPVRRSSRQIIKLLKEYAGTEGSSVVEFCKLHGINKSNFYNWQKRYGFKQVKQDKPKGFVPLQLTPSSQPPDSAPCLFAEVNGIRLYHFVAAEYLKALLP